MNNNLGIFVIYSCPGSSVNYAAHTYACFLFSYVKLSLQTAIPCMISMHQLLDHQAGFLFLETLLVLLPNAYVPQTLPLSLESLDTGS